MHITKKSLSPQFLPYFKISNTRLLALHWSKKLTDPANHITLTVYSLLPECTNYHFSRKIHHFWRSRTKNRIHQNTPFQVQRKNVRRGLSPPQTFPGAEGYLPLHNQPFSYQAFWIRPCVPPEFHPARFTPLGLNREWPPLDNVLLQKPWISLLDTRVITLSKLISGNWARCINGISTTCNFLSPKWAWLLMMFVVGMHIFVAHFLLLRILADSTPPASIHVPRVGKCTLVTCPRGHFR